MISLIATVYNEKNNLPAWFDSLLQQSFQPDEIVIVDGGSSDGTWEWLQDKATNVAILRVIQKKGNISVGRNEAIRHAHGDTIVVADAGCVYDATWFETLTQTMTKERATFATTAFGPFLEASRHGLVQYCIAAATTPAPHEFQKDWFASSRSVAFTKALWEKVGGYPEWLPICEDIVFDKNILSHNSTVAYVRTPLVFWEPRPTLFAYMRQLYKYTRGDGHALLNTYRQIIRYAAYSIGVVLLVVALDGGILASMVLVLGFFGYMKKFVQRHLIFSSKASRFIRWGGVIGVCFVVVLGDVAKMSGWPMGIVQRIFRIVSPNT